MKSYLEACGVPTTVVGGVELPRLIMGIHPYDGCSYVDCQRDQENLRAFGQAAKVADVIRYAVQEAGVTVAQVDHMLPVLDRLHLQAIWEAEQVLQTKIGLVAYILIPITLDGELVSESPRAHATFFAENEKLGGDAFREHLRHDGILHYNLGGSWSSLATPDTVDPFTPAEASRFRIEYDILERTLGFFEGCDILIADPGCEGDLLAMTGRLDLIREYLDFLRRRYGTVITSVHHAGVAIPRLEEAGIAFDGYLTPVNQPGMAMTPTRDLALDALRQTTKPVIAIKPMAGGRFLGRRAFEFVFEEVGVAATMFGMGTIAQVRETTSAARQVLGVS